MIPTGSKLWFGIAGFAFVGTVAYFLASNGEELGSVILLSLVLAAFTLGLLASFIRDGDVGLPGTPGGEGGPAAAPGTTLVGERAAVGAQTAAAWPAMAAVGAGLVAVGLAGAGDLLLYLGLLVAAAAGIEWMVSAWAERATADPIQNRALRNRLMFPVEIPVLAAAAIALVVVAFSRVLLAVSKVGSTVVAIVVASVILGVAFLLTSRPKIGSSLLTGVVVVGAVALLGGGVVGAVAGEREFEVHEGEEGHGGEGGEGLPGIDVLVSASNVQDFDQDQVNVVAGAPVTITFENQQGGVQHNLHITEPDDLVQSDPMIGPSTDTFEVTFEEPGEYTFICDVHPVMESVFVAVEQPAGEEEPDEGEEGGGADIGGLDGEEDG